MFRLSKTDFDFSKTRIVFLFVFGLFGIIFDQLTKAWALENLESGPKLLGDTNIGFSLTFNSGSAFSLFENSTIFITIAACAIVMILIYAGFKTEHNLTSFAYFTIAVGAMGNIIDRFFRYPYFGHGNVTDFIKVMSFPTFNIADSLVCIGAFLLLVSSFKKSERIHG